MIIRTLKDARTNILNSGLADWEFAGNASLEGLVEFTFRHCDELYPSTIEGVAVAYLASVGEDPHDYGLPPLAEFKGESLAHRFERDHLSDQEIADAIEDSDGWVVTKIVGFPDGSRLKITHESVTAIRGKTKAR